MQAPRRLLDRVEASWPDSACKRYGDHNGDLLAAGVGYFAFFSIFPALALAFAIFGFVLRATRTCWPRPPTRSTRPSRARSGPATVGRTSLMQHKLFLVWSTRPMQRTVFGDRN